MMRVLWFQEYTAEHETKAMSSLFQLVCHLYQVKFLTLTVKADARLPRHQDVGINLLLLHPTLFSGGEAGGLHRRSGQAGQELLLNTTEATPPPLLPAPR